MHLGVSPDAGKAFSDKRPSEIWDSFTNIITVCEQERADLLLIAGDLFHRQPLLRELKEVNYLFSKLTHTKVVLIAGNHDYVKTGSYYRSFQWNNNVHPLLGEHLETIEFPELHTAVSGFSYYSKEITDSRYDTAAAEKVQKYEILLAHGGDEKHIPIQKHKLAGLGYDYIAFGHIHKPQQIAGEAICYAGAPEPTDKNDTGPHGYIIGQINKDGLRTKFIPSASREYMHLALTVNQGMTGRKLREAIAEVIEERGTANIYKFILKGFRDPEVLFDLEQIDPFGNILEIIDETRPAYDFDKLAAANAGNLLGKYIYQLKDFEEGSLESQALYEGVQAILKAKKG